MSPRPAFPPLRLSIRRLAAIPKVVRTLPRLRLLNLAGIYAGTSVLNAAVPFLLLPILTRVLTPADYGIIAMFGIVINVLNAVVGFNTHGAISVRYFQLERERLSAYIGSCLGIMAVSAVAAAIVVVVASEALSRVTQVPPSWLLWAVLASACQFVILLRLTLWQMQGRAWSYGAFQGAQSITNAGLSLLLVLGLSMSWQGRGAAQVATALAFAMLATVSLWTSREVSLKANRQDIRNALRFGVPLVPHTAGALLIAVADRALVANILGVAEAGVYVVAAQIGLALGLLTDAFNKAYAPWLFERLSKQDAKRDEAIVRGTYFYFVVVVMIGLSIGGAAPWIIPLLVGPQFHEASSLVIYIALGYSFGGMYYMVTNYVFYGGRTGLLACVTLSAGLLNIVATYLLIRQNGIVGAAQGFMLSQAVLFLGTWWLAQRARPMPWRRALRGLAVGRDPVAGQ